MAAFRGTLFVALAAVGFILTVAGCAEAPVDPVKDNAGKGKAVPVPGRPGRNETQRLTEYEQNRANQ